MINKQALSAISVLYFAFFILAFLNFRKAKRVIGVMVDIYSRLEPTSRTRASRQFIICNLSRRTSVTILRKFVICISFRMYIVSSATYQLHEAVPSLNEFSPRAFLPFMRHLSARLEFSGCFSSCLLRAACREG